MDGNAGSAGAGPASGVPVRRPDAQPEPEDAVPANWLAAGQLAPADAMPWHWTGTRLELADGSLRRWPGAGPDTASDVFWRAIGRAATIGLICGACTPLWVGLLIYGPQGGVDDALAAVFAGLLASPFGAFVGALAGVLCALVPAAVLAWRTEYFRRHLEAAAACAASVDVLLMAVVFTVTVWSAHGSVLDGLISAAPLAAGALAAARTLPKVLWVLPPTGARVLAGHPRLLVSGRLYRGNRTTR